MADAVDASLVVRGLNVAYGESKVLFDIDFDVAPNQIVCCVGRNGAGKTTLLRSIAGFLKPSSGVATAGGVNLIGHRPYDVARMGVKYVPQDKKVFSDLTVRENLELGSYATRDYNWDPVFEYFPKLKILIDRKAGFLSGGERQMLMKCRACDRRAEPAAGLFDRAQGLCHARRPHRRRIAGRRIAETGGL
jgi:branched-chain amino acid transport system ATP-binding protein